MEEEKKKPQEWQRKDDLEQYVIRLKNKYRSELDHIIPDSILYAAFSKKKSSVKANIRAISGVWALFKNECYILSVHLENWNELTEQQKMYLIYHELLHIPEYGFVDGEKDYKKIVKHDLQDFKILVDEFGVYQEEINKIIDKSEAKEDEE
jgi:predicted metallopeptidase